MRKFLPLILNSQASKLHTQQENKSNYLPIPREQASNLLMSNVSCACIIREITDSQYFFQKHMNI